MLKNGEVSDQEEVCTDPGSLVKSQAMPENMIGSSASVLICSYVLYIRTDCVVSIIIYLPTFPIVTLMLNLYVLVISYLDHG